MRGGRSTDEQIIGVLREAGTLATTRAVPPLSTATRLSSSSTNWWPLAGRQQAGSARHATEAGAEG